MYRKPTESAWRHVRSPADSFFSSSTDMTDDNDQALEALANVRRRVERIALDLDKLEDALRGKTTTQPALFQVADDVTPDNVLSGRFDSVDRRSQGSRPVCEALLRLWCDEWGKDHRRTKVTGERAKWYRAALRDGFTPSQFAKAIIGMRCDEWADRARYCEWKHVQKQLPRWLDYYEQWVNGALSKTAFPTSLPFKTMKVRGVVVPIEYEWNQYDDRARDDGRRFDPRTCKWLESSDDGYDELEVFND